MDYFIPRSELPKSAKHGRYGDQTRYAKQGAVTRITLLQEPNRDCRQEEDDNKIGHGHHLRVRLTDRLNRRMTQRRLLFEARSPQTRLFCVLS